ncbi:pseudaminic acid cytidylyltransferase [Enteroscipio rubneri]|uniref:Pseudaminic acid cytidylyltransferase n=1 Tax=Enteroscipio rubneri TaxID=2070686 RepID=A0A2K2U9D3_9ACTN|nr:pseudaminic acid cytidylyltransferase [Enteroscipio rubneri]PNV66933.1 pseudaminic acid cytidylyltransferase [Enteroscipio rubneri]
MSIVAVITARGGSKRIPHKNVKSFCGKPIIAYSIDAALRSSLFDEVMVSTDDVEIADISRQYGARVPFMRSTETSNDFATTADVLAEVLEVYARGGMAFDEVCCIYPTAPFVTPQKLNEAKRLFDRGCDSVLSAVRFSFPPQRGFVVCEGRLSWWFPECSNMRSQDLEPIYHDAGQFYFVRSKVIIEERSLIGPYSQPYEVAEDEAQDIDTPSDWKIAEMKFERMLAHE